MLENLIEKDPLASDNNKTQRYSKFKTVATELETFCEFTIKPATKATNSIHTSKYTIWSFFPINFL